MPVSVVDQLRNRISRDNELAPDVWRKVRIFQPGDVVEAGVSGLLGLGLGVGEGWWVEGQGGGKVRAIAQRASLTLSHGRSCMPAQLASIML